MKKTWIITGASAGGIGEGIARAVLSNGDNAVITARSLAKLESIAKDYPDTCLPMTLDMSDVEQMQNIVAKTVEKFG
ncbi:MAG: SDR family NAD(P)-dependent oxidoreductase, partial [Solobacterium sp.]|nr:SDR family NAD(P)-dependent oxidoreductase [Solobacterium sp.]